MVVTVNRTFNNFI